MMLQEQQPSIEVPSTSLETENAQQSILSSYIIKPEECNIEDDFIVDYGLFRQRLSRQSCFSRFKAKSSRCASYTLAIFKELWRQIIPPTIRGHIGNNILPESYLDNDRDSKFFDEYIKKKARFFLIVFDDNCTEEEMQEAFEKSSYIVLEGRGIRLNELSNKTNCFKWKIQGWGRLKHYSILFFKFDMFGHMRHFGNLSKQLIDAYPDDQTFLDNYKNQLNAAYERFEAIEREFCNSYLEKEDRMHFE